MINCIIIDDDAAARLIIEQLCSKHDNLNVMEQFDNGLSAIKYVNDNEVDLIFLDIHMPKITGFDFINSLTKPPQIILTTTDSNFALKAFNYSCVIDYLLKPIEEERFKSSIGRIKQDASLNGETFDEELYVNIDRRLVKIMIPDIYLIEAKGDYIQIKAEDKNHIVHTTMKKIEEKLPRSVFLKVHRSYIINTKKIIDIEDNSVLIKKDVVPVSRSNRPELMRRLNLL